MYFKNLNTILKNFQVRKRGNHNVNENTTIIKYYISKLVGKKNGSDTLKVTCRTNLKEGIKRKAEIDEIVRKETDPEQKLIL